MSIGGIFPVAVQQRGDQARGGARPRRGRDHVPELHLRRVLQQVLEQEPGPGALPRAFLKRLASSSKRRQPVFRAVTNHFLVLCKLSHLSCAFKANYVPFSVPAAL